MSRRFTCLNGHSWQSESSDSPSDSTRVLPHCPICGLSGEVRRSNGSWVPGIKDSPTSRLDSDEVRYASQASIRLGRIQPPVLPGYEIQDEIGRGGMGVVYRAIDMKRGGLVAVKYLPRLEPAMLLRFKQEFRAISDLSHPNLAAVHELRQVNGNWCLVMELVEGEPFTDRFAGIADLEERVKQLSGALRQLTEGLRFLHEAGLLHCDVKPTNVIVTPQGRVVLLDFGLVSEWKPERPDGPIGELVGSLGYIAPERFNGKSATAATDWYSVGVILYETLVGRRPFQGSRTNLIWQQQYMQPPPPAEVVAGVPEAWSQLCAALLDRDPAKRAGAETVLSFLDGENVVPRTHGDSLRVRDVPLVGRDRQLATLQAAWEKSGADRAVIVRVQGRTGMGKSTLVSRFLDRLAQREPVVVLRGRCHEQESVPNKAMDSLIDSLCHFLAQLDQDALAPLIPDGIASLSRMFPVLRRLRLGAAHWKIADHSDPAELRRQAGAALRDLLNNLAKYQPLVLWLDDLQWGDADSARLAEELLRPPHAPPILFIASYRSEDQNSSFPRYIAGLEESSSLALFDIELGELTALEAGSLAQALLADDASADEHLATHIGRESRGWPLFVLELARFYSEQAGERAADRPAEISLERVIQTRMSRLTAAERRLLGVLAVAGQPVREATAIRAAELSSEPLTALNRLRAGHWVRTRESDADHWVECYHDGVRDLLMKSLPESEQAGNHDRLARAYAAAHPVEHALLAVHCLGAGRPDEAAEHYLKAADEAAEALAFDRAAQLYRLGLDLRARPPQDASPLWKKLADALANAGHAAEAARAYQAACNGSDRTQVMQLKRRAAHQLCVSGHIDEGLMALREVLATADLSLPASPARAIMALLRERLRMRWRGLDFHERHVEEISGDDLERIDLCWAATAGLSLFDVISGAYFQALHLRHALAAGEPIRLARALSWEAAHASADGPRSAQRVAKLLESARRLAERHADPHPFAWHALAEGIVHHNFGNWQVAHHVLVDAERQLRTHCAGVAWERDVALAFQAWSLFQLGQFTELAALSERLGQEAKSRNDRFAAIHLAAFATPLARLSADDPAGARAAIGDQPPGLAAADLPSMSARISECRIDLYENKPGDAWKRLNAAWHDWESARFHRIQRLRVATTHLRGVAAVCLAAGADLKPMLRRAERDAAALERERLPWSSAMAKLNRAAVKNKSGDPVAARDLLSQASDELDRATMPAYAAAARFWRGKLQGGTAEQNKAIDELHSMGALNPQRMAAMLVPGFE